jgi:hypothetical protein
VFELEVFHILVEIFNVELGSLYGFAAEVIGERLLFGPVDEVVVDDFHESELFVDSHGLGIGLEVFRVLCVFFH